MKIRIAIISILIIFISNIVLAQSANISVNNVEKHKNNTIAEEEKEQLKEESQDELKLEEQQVKDDMNSQNLEEKNIQILNLENKNDAVVKEGIYRISMHTNNHLVLQVENSSKKVEANINLDGWLNKENEHKKFNIKYEEDTGYYIIQNINSENVLDVQNGGMISGTNVWQHKPNGTDAQKWKIEENDDGSYSFVSKKNGLYLNIESGNLSSGSNVQVYSKNNSNSQKFNLICLDDKPEKIVENGVYEIALKTDNNITLQIEGESRVNGGNVNTGKWIDGSKNLNRKFEIKYCEDDGYYIIKSMNSGKVLEVQNGGVKNGSNVSQYSENYTDAQRWKIEKNDDESYSFISKKSGLYLDVAGGEKREGANIQIYERLNGDRQKFNLILREEKLESTIEDGIYRISMFDSKYSHMAIEIANASKQVEANVQIGQWFNKNNEKNKFEFKYDEESGYYTIESINSGNVLDVKNGGMTSGTNVWQHKPNGTDAQKWEVIKNYDGSYSIISKKNGLFLNVQNGNMSSGANIQVCEAQDDLGQKFQLISLDKIPEQVIENGTYIIETADDSNKVLEVKDLSKNNGANIQIGNWTNSVYENKIFKLTYNKDDGYYTIESVNSGKVFDAQNGGMTAGTNIWQYDGNYTDAQRWKIEKNNDGSYSFVCKKSGLYLDIRNNNVEINNKSESISQKFKLTLERDKNKIANLESGTYKIVLAVNQDLALDIDKASREKTANIVLGNASDTIRNEFNLTRGEDGYYTITSINSGNVLDVQNRRNDKWN